MANPPEPGLERLNRRAPIPPPAPPPPPPQPPPLSGHGLGNDDREPLFPPQVGAATPRQPLPYARLGPCTATHIGSGYFLTAGHCINQEPGYLGYRNSVCPSDLELVTSGQRVPCRVAAYSYDNQSDYAVLAADPVTVGNLPWVPVDYGFDWTVEKNRKVRLVGLSQAQIRQNRRCEVRYQADLKRLLHDCDTDPGDSGATLIDLATEHVIGVHAGGLKNSVNYGWPVGQVPWTESICVAVLAPRALTVPPGGVPTLFRLSTTARGPFQRLTIELTGTQRRADLKINLLAPNSRAEIDNSLLSWRLNSWRWRDVFVLKGAGEGPWAVEIINRAPKGATNRQGKVAGRIFVCP